MTRAGRLAGSGTDGTRLGTHSAIRPSATTPTISAPWSQTRVCTARGERVEGRADSARMTPPTGRVAAPVSETTPFISTMKPGLASPWTRRSDAMTVKAVPTRTARASARRQPPTERTTPAAVARSDESTTVQKWVSLESCTWSRLTKWISAGGRIAIAPQTTSRDVNVSRRTCRLSAGAHGILTSSFPGAHGWWKQCGRWSNAHKGGNHL